MVATLRSSEEYLFSNYLTQVMNNKNVVMNRTMLVVISLFFSMHAQGKKVPKYIREKFTNCYTGDTTQINNLIRIDGYYRLKELRYTYSKPTVVKNYDTSYHNFVFYEDGTFIYNYWDATTLTNIDSSEKHFHEAITERLNNQELYYNSFTWGIYRVEGDTIITQRIFNAALLAPWDAWEDKYIVINNETLEIIPSGTRPLHKMNNDARKQTQEEMALRKILPIKFHQKDNLPNPDSWLKNESWTKCK